MSFEEILRPEPGAATMARAQFIFFMKWRIKWHQIGLFKAGRYRGNWWPHLHTHSLTSGYIGFNCLVIAISQSTHLGMQMGWRRLTVEAEHQNGGGKKWFRTRWALLLAPEKLVWLRLIYWGFHHIPIVKRTQITQYNNHWLQWTSAK